MIMILIKYSIFFVFLPYLIYRYYFKATPKENFPFISRCIAFVYDIFTLLIVQGLIAIIFFNFFSAHAVLSLALGFIMTITYFALCESSILGGQTIGKSIVNIVVVDKTGHFISLPRAILRSSIYFSTCICTGLIYILNSHLLAYIFASVAIGLSFVKSYTFIFNRRTRQSLHDLVVGAIVKHVDGTEKAPLTTKIWRGHLLVSCLIVLVVFIYMQKMFFSQHDFNVIYSDKNIDILQQHVAKMDLVLGNSVFLLQPKHATNNAINNSMLVVKVFLRKNPTNKELQEVMAKIQAYAKSDIDVAEASKVNIIVNFGPLFIPTMKIIATRTGLYDIANGKQNWLKDDIKMVWYQLPKAIYNANRRFF